MKLIPKHKEIDLIILSPSPLLNSKSGVLLLSKSAQRNPASTRHDFPYKFEQSANHLPTT
jgi:hypothetical protein